MFTVPLDKLPHMATRTALDTVYLVNDTGKDVSLEIIIGAIGQTASSSIELDDQVLIADQKGSLPEMKVGINQLLSNKELRVISTVTDTSQDSNYTEMILRLRGGVVFREYVLSKTVDENGESVPYLCIIKFYKA
ncbi:hypothetical protein SAMN05421788_1011509 [Filimonas lacunae]|uniref:Uncharacterized protein n=2 Tax=Filimonas lacunae TaxID=477680 RepID=A0A1N7MC64_9BACT|nr:hypothetical protein SAMN05421788_1011509 [Filimonas lacunae]